MPNTDSPLEPTGVCLMLMPTYAASVGRRHRTSHQVPISPSNPAVLIAITSVCMEATSRISVARRAKQKCFFFYNAQNLRLARDFAAYRRG